MGRLVVLFMFLSHFTFTSQLVSAQGNINKDVSKSLLKDFSKLKAKSFKSFLKAIQGSKSYDQLDSAIDSYLSKSKTSKDMPLPIYRLLGLYTRLRYGGEARHLLAKLVELDTSKSSAQAQHENPNIIKMGEELAKVAKNFGLSFRNVDNRVFEISLPGKGRETIALHAHADVVPANEKLWVLEDGRKLNPFKLTYIGDRMYGRGAEDDKNGIVVSLYAMKTILEEKLPLHHKIKLLVDTTEETGAEAMDYYFSRHPKPQYNIALDGSYPLIIAEKGYGVVKAEFPIRETKKNSDPAVISITGGLASNQIPAKSTARFISSNPHDLERAIRPLADEYIKDHGKNFSISTSKEKNSLLLTVSGVSAHSSDPGSGVNPVSRMLGFLAKLHPALKLQDNHITDAAQYASENWGLDYLGAKLGIGFSHGFMGPLTTALTYIGEEDGKLELAVNLRIPVGKKSSVLRDEIESKLIKWRDDQDIDMDLGFYMGEPMYRNPKGTWVNALLDVATENLGLERKFGSSSGGTSVHNLPNGVQFGLSMPGVKYTGHNANEFKTVEQFELDLQIVTEAVARLGSLESLD